MRIGVIGLGFMGSAHLEAYPDVDGCELAAVASSSDRKLAGDLADVGGNLDRGGGRLDFGPAARYKRAADLIHDPRVEAVDICTPTDLHKPLALQALAAGKHVLVEKPMALTEADCTEMIEAASAAGKVLMVAQVLRFLPEYVAARSRVLSGELGSVRAAWLRRRCAAPAWGAWLQDPARSGGGVFDLLIHDLDYCRQLFGRPDAVCAIGVEDRDHGIDVVETRLDYGDGVPVIITGGWHHPASFPFSMEFTIVCETGTLDYSSSKQGLALYTSEGMVAEVELSARDGFVGELQAFVDSCATGVAPTDCPPEQSADSVAMALAMGRSRARGGAKVTLD